MTWSVSQAHLWSQVDFFCIEHEMDGQSLVALIDDGIPGPDCLKELILKIGVQLKVFSYIKEEIAKDNQVSLQMKYKHLLAS